MNNKFNGKPFFIVVIERDALVVAYFFNMVMVGPNHSITVYFYFERCVNNHNLLLLMMINKLALNQIEHSKAKSMDNNLSIWFTIVNYVLDKGVPGPSISFFYKIKETEGEKKGQFLSNQTL